MASNGVEKVSLLAASSTNTCVLAALDQRTVR
jgi:hypothetical protein